MNDWREAFVAMSALLGEPLDNFTKDPDLPLARDLRDQDKSRRALALSRALGVIVLAAESIAMEVQS